jgi:Flp pilus assembly protein TadD
VTAVSSRDWLSGGDALIDARRYQEALTLASQALADQPQDPRAHALAARALSGLDRTDEATSAAWQAVSLAPQVAYYHRLLAIILQKPAHQGERRASHDRLLYASAQALEAVHLAPADAANYVVLAETYARLGDRRQADGAVRKALELNPHSANTWANASFVATRARNWYAAEIAARKALAIDPNNYAATNNLGVALRSRGRWMQGAVAFHGAARIDPRSPTARDNVESIGFQYLHSVGLVLLLPLLIVWPLYILAGRRLAAARPERLRPMARRIGLWVATSKRHQRAFAKEAARAEKLAAAVPSDGWSSLRSYRHDNSLLGAAGAGALVLAAVFTTAATDSSTSPGSATVVVFFVLAAVAVITAIVCAGTAFWRRRHSA